MKSYLPVCAREREWLMRVLLDLVQTESPSTDPGPLEACADRVSAWCVEAGGQCRRTPAHGTAAHVISEWPGAGARILMLGHFDTVWPVGQISRMPPAERDGKFFGPGALDMKGGLAIGLAALKALAADPDLGVGRPHVTFLITSDEEVGSTTSRALIEDLARESAAVLVVEPSVPGGALKTARKGVGEFELLARGVASHAGADPGSGASAILELSRQIAVLDGLNDVARGRSVNVGVIEGGTRGNVVASQARAVIDVRVSRLDDAPVVEAAIHGLRAVNPRVRLEVSGAVDRPPMERSDGVARLFHLAREVGRRDGWEPTEGSTGGASDGNFTAAIGVPTLDGLGAVGDGAHALHEHVVVDELPRRASLLAGVMATLGRSAGLAQ